MCQQTTHARVVLAASNILDCPFLQTARCCHQVSWENMGNCQILRSFPANIPISVSGLHRDVFCEWCQFLLIVNWEGFPINKNTHLEILVSHNQNPSWLQASSQAHGTFAYFQPTTCPQTAAVYDSNVDANQTTTPSLKLKEFYALGSSKQYVTFPKLHYRVQKSQKHSSIVTT